MSGFFLVSLERVARFHRTSYPAKPFPLRFAAPPLDSATSSLERFVGKVPSFVFQ